MGAFCVERELSPIGVVGCERSGDWFALERASVIKQPSGYHKLIFVTTKYSPHRFICKYY